MSDLGSIAGIARPAHIKPYVPTEEETLPPVPVGFDQWEEASGLPGTVEFENVGDYVAGHFRTVEENIGPNKSRMYYILRHPEKDLVGIWGSTALNQKMKLLNPQPGDGVLIQYLGEKETERGQNPVKTFRVRIKRKA